MSTSTSRETGQALRTFTGFPELPPEIRIKVWTYLAFIPRNVDIWTSSTGDPINLPNCNDVVRPFRYRTNCPQPALLHACSEARFEGLKYYRKDFGTTQPYGVYDAFDAQVNMLWGAVTLPLTPAQKLEIGRKFDTEPSIYVNYHVDRVCFADSLHLPVTYRENRLQHWVSKQWIETEGNWGARPDGPRFLALNANAFVGRIHDMALPSLDELVIFHSSDDLDRKGTIEFEEIGRGWMVANPKIKRKLGKAAIGYQMYCQAAGPRLLATPLVRHMAIVKEAEP